MARVPSCALPVPGARAVGVLAGRSAHDHRWQGAHHLPWSEEGGRERGAHHVGAGETRHQGVVRCKGHRACREDERNLSSAARAYHEENKEDHARTRGTVEKAARDVLGAQVAMQATVEDIASCLGVGMDKKRKKTIVRAIRARHVSS